MKFARKEELGRVYPDAYDISCQAALVKWLNSVHKLRESIAFAWSPLDAATFRLMATSRTEGENATAKRGGVLSNSCSFQV